MDGDCHDLNGGDLAEIGKKRNTDYDFPPPFYVGGKQQVVTTNGQTVRNAVGTDFKKNVEEKKNYQQRNQEHSNRKLGT